MKKIVNFFVLSCLMLVAQSVFAQWEGVGTADTPYQISTVADLQQLATNVNNGTKYLGKHFKQVNDIDLGGIANWTPIGTSSTRYFSGIFDGDSKIISNLKINITSASSDVYAGLFGYMQNGSLQNIGLQNNQNIVNITTSYNVFAGGLVGWAGANSSSTLTIANCYATGDVSAKSSYSYAGGLVGYASGIHTIANCYAIGDVSSFSSSYSYAGGLVGWAGANSSSTLTIANCYATGDISVMSSISSIAGGLVGRAETYSNSTLTIVNCYATGDVSASFSTYLGGFIGYRNGGTISNCYWNTETSGLSKGVEIGSTTGITGKTTESMQSQAFVDLLNTNAGEFIWRKALGNDNGGYPILAW